LPVDQILVIFGASGDLTEKKLIPAIYALKKRGLLPKSFAVLGTGRTGLSDEEFREKMQKKGAGYDIDFLNLLYYQPLDPMNPEMYYQLRERLRHLDHDFDVKGNYIFYLATPPLLYETVAEGLAASGLNHDEQDGGLKRLIIEKPFGYSLETAKSLNSKLLQFFDERQLYRIDHYLGKETAQNILVFRFANGIFEPLWNRNYIDHIQVTSSESIGVENRGGYYDTAGSLRDMVQNHLLQLVALAAMEPPAGFDADSIRNETVKVFQSIKPLSDEDIRNNVVRGQYIASKIKGEPIKAYREEKGVNPNSRTETFAALKFYIDNWRWGGVPFYIRSGKRLPTRVTEIVVRFKNTPHRLFRNTFDDESGSNQLVIRIQPDEGMLIRFALKEPGAGYHVKNESLNFHYSSMSDARLPEAYERLINDCMMGDSTLYTRGDALEACWKFIDPILNAWKTDCKIKVYGYPAGTWGPEEADALLHSNGQTWRYPCKNLTDDDGYCEL
jgi:glucose-6-phosphate 1-dehydrogenase